MKEYIIRYKTKGVNGSIILHREVFFSKILALVNFYMARLDKSRADVTLKEEDNGKDKYSGRNNRDPVWLAGWGIGGRSSIHLWPYRNGRRNEYHPRQGR